jgi:hypothetical protein
MRNSEIISRRSFLAASVATGSLALSSGEARAQGHASPHSIELGRHVKKIGRLQYVQFHTREDFSLETAAITIEQLAQGRMLEKVSALGNAKFIETPDKYLATVYYDKGFKGSILSTEPSRGAIGVVRGELGSIVLSAGALTVRDEHDAEVLTTAIRFRSLSGGSKSFPLILESLRDEKTIFPK